MNVGRTRKQFQAGGGNNAQRAFGTDKQVFQVVASIVLAKPCQAAPDAAVGQNCLEAEAEIPRRAVSENPGAACIGRKIAADPGRAFAAKAEGEITVGFLGDLLDVGQDHTRLNRNRIIQYIELTDLVHPGQSHDNFAAMLIGRCPAAQAGIAALWHDRGPGFVADTHDL